MAGIVPIRLGSINTSIKASKGCVGTVLRVCRVYVVLYVEEFIESHVVL